MIDIIPGAIIQVTAKNDMYYGDLVVVTEVKNWGIQGYLCSPFQRPGLTRFKGVAYVRINKDDFEIVGKTDLVIE